MYFHGLIAGVFIKTVKVSLFYHFVRSMANWNGNVAGVMLLYVIEDAVHCL
jgi:hypothetical protein